MTEYRELQRLRAGETARISRVSSAVSAAKRLADLGFVRGTLLEMVRPGRPCIVRIKGVCVGLGYALQDSIKLSTA